MRPRELVGIVGVVLLVDVRALQLASAPRAHGVRPRALTAMDGATDLASIFEDKPPPTWGSASWRWGSAVGAAHDVAMRVRSELDRPHRRSAFVTYAKGGAVDLVDLKMALALTCQRARNMGYDAPDGRWEALMEEMAAAKFMSEGLIVLEDLAAAANSRLAAPLSDEELAAEPIKALALALVELDFVQKGC